MGDSPLRNMRNVMSGGVTAQRVAAAEEAAVPKKKKKVDPAAPAPVYKPPAAGVAAFNAAKEAQRKADERAIAAMVASRGFRR